jgi:hypothetical protein
MCFSQSYEICYINNNNNIAAFGPVVVVVDNEFSNKE